MLPEMISRGAPSCAGGRALVQSVAQALTLAIDDPAGHHAWSDSGFRTGAAARGGSKHHIRHRGAEETIGAVTVFDSSSVPPIGIEKYLWRLAATFRCSDASFVSALIVVDRLLAYDGGRLPLTERNVHRIFLASLVVSVKYHEDLVYSNGHYAKAGGVHVREVNRLERTLLTSLDFDLRVHPEQFQFYENMLLDPSQCVHVQSEDCVSPERPLAAESPCVPDRGAERLVEADRFEVASCHAAACAA